MTFHRARKYNPKDHMEVKELKQIRVILSRKDDAGGTTMSDFKLAQSQSDRGSVTPSERHTARWDRKDPNVNTHCDSHLDFEKGTQKKHRKKAFQQMVRGKLGIHMQKNENRFISRNLHKKQLKMDQKLKYKRNP